jgi:hypothetical protein
VGRHHQGAQARDGLKRPAVASWMRNGPLALWPFQRATAPLSSTLASVWISDSGARCPAR